MATITELKSRREALAASRSSGVARVSYDGKTVEYGSADDLLKRIRTIEAKITASSGVSRPIAGYAGFGRGDR